MVGLAGGFVVLALYGKYRIIKQQYLEERAAEEARLRSQAPDSQDHLDPPISP